MMAEAPQHFNFIVGVVHFLLESNGRTCRQTSYVTMRLDELTVSRIVVSLLNDTSK